jgi:hypothetical protein
MVLSWYICVVAVCIGLDPDVDGGTFLTGATNE